jgi:hypothetical protein
VGLAIVVVAMLLCSCSESHGPRANSLLVVGDSVAAQSAEALIHLAPSGTTVSVDAAQPGTAPCDWAHGFTDPVNKKFQSFTDIVAEVRPAVVSFVFTGNPGLSGPAAGCVDANSSYDLPQLLATYKASLTEMADEATREGAIVYFEAPPPRNPASPLGYDPATGVNHGFQGSSSIASFYHDLAAEKSSGQWRFDDTAAAAVSTPDLSWRLTLPCQAWDRAQCNDGQVRVRAGGNDAVHLDEAGCGAIRFALALEQRAFTALSTSVAPIDPDKVAVTVAGYGGCS